MTHPLSALRVLFLAVTLVAQSLGYTPALSAQAPQPTVVQADTVVIAATPDPNPTHPASPQATPTIPTASATPAASPTPAEPTVTPSAPLTNTVEITPEQGGMWQSDDGTVTLAVLRGAIAAPARLHIFDALQLPASLAHLPLLFGFELRDAVSAAPLAALNQPLTLTWRYNGDNAPSNLRLWRVEADTQAMSAVTNAIFDAAGLTAQLDAPGVYAATSAPPAETFFLPRIQAGQVDTFTGDASFTYDFDTPAGVGGLQLPLTLRYSSGIPNTSGFGTLIDGGWVGAGWTLDVGEIALTEGYSGTLTLGSLSSPIKLTDKLSQIAGEWHEPDLGPGCTYTGDPALDTGAGFIRARWRALHEQFARIESDRFSSTMNGHGSTGCGQVGNLLYAGHFDVWAKDGTRYVFGNDPVTYTPQPCDVAEEGSGSRQAYWADGDWTRRYSVYKLDTMTDLHGNTIRIEYDVKIKHKWCELRAFREAYPKRILYTTNPTAGDHHAEYEIEFIIAPKDVDPKPEPLISQTGWLLKEIIVSYRPQAGVPLQRIRSYKFTYVDYDAPQMYLLESVQEFGQDETSALPATTFTYYYDDSHQVGWKSNSNDGTCGWSNSEQRPFLRSISNGYDGQVQYDYTPQYLPDGYTGSIWGDVGDGLMQKVQRRTVTAGLGAPQVTEYQRFAPSYHRILDCSDYEPTKNKEFIGYGRVVAEAKGPDGQVLRRTETLFHNAWTGATAIPHDPLRGKAYQTTAGGWNGAAWLERRIVDTAWATVRQTDLLGGGAVPWPADVAFTYPAEIKTTEVAADGGVWDRKTKNYYDVGWQDACNAQGGQYGNLTRVEEYGLAASNTPYRTTLMGYCPNTGAWILDRPAFQNSYVGLGPTQPGSGGGPLLASTIYSYADDPANPSPNWQTPIGNKGELRGTRRWAFTDSTRRYVDTRHWHDARGNVTDVVEFASYGTADAWATTWLRQRHAVYDALHGSFKVREDLEPKLGVLPPKQTTEYFYYGVNGDAEGGLPGQLQRTKTANDTANPASGAETWQVYDTFGRLLKQWQPYDSETHPTISYEYLDAYAGPTTAMRKTEQAIAGDPDQVRRSITFFDGLGRVVQSKLQSVVDTTTTDTEMIITDRTYDALGRAAAEYVPYKETSNAYAYEYRPLNTSQPKTSYAYDGLDRVVSLTQPDGTATTTIYWICYNPGDPDFQFPRACETVTDANGHKVRYAADAFGRLRSVTQGYDATEVRSRYVYDVADRLLSVEDPGGAMTTLTYDPLGRKLTLVDPDMGQWQYHYDAASNLVGQRDAQQQATCLLYDAFGRLTGKNYTAGVSDIKTFSCPSRQDVGYSYDSGANGLGRRTGMWTATNSAQWRYDLRGRLIGATQTVTGTGTFATAWSYDSMNRLSTQVYPACNCGQTGETVRLTYNAAGLLQTVSGVFTYVGNTEYNALGQVTLRNLGMVSQRYTYPQTQNYRLGTLTSGTSPNYNGLQNISYTYDHVGNVLTIQDAAAAGGAQTQTFSYDLLDRLSTATASGSTLYGGYVQKSYGYAANGNLTLFEGATLEYTDPQHRHAVTLVSGEPRYSYDANGNATQRLGADGATYAFTYDFENRLTELRKNGAVISTFVYDGDGNRIAETTGGVTTVYIGNYYEWTPSRAKRYYYAGDVRVAVYDYTTLYRLLSDHLASTAITVNASAVRQAELRYMPFGKTRYTSGVTPTSFRYTGQRQQTNANELYFYNSRWYDPYLNRWIQPDTIVPDPYNPQSLNRYSYVLNNPLRYTDPSGHAQVCADGDEGGGCGYAATPGQILASIYDSHLLDLYLWSYMRTHPNYKPTGDPDLTDDASRFIAANAQFQVLVSPLRPTDPTIDITPLLAAGGTLASFAIPLDPPGTQSGNVVGGRIHSRYADGTPVYRKQEPPHIAGPLPEAQGPHTVLRWDKVNNRIYQARTYDAAGNPVLDAHYRTVFSQEAVTRLSF